MEIALWITQLLIMSALIAVIGVAAHPRATAARIRPFARSSTTSSTARVGSAHGSSADGSSAAGGRNALRVADLSSCRVLPTLDDAATLVSANRSIPAQRSIAPAAPGLLLRLPGVAFFHGHDPQQRRQRHGIARVAPTLKVALRERHDVGHPQQRLH